jgi:hypothetical protein
MAYPYLENSTKTVLAIAFVLASLVIICQQQWVNAPKRNDELILQNSNFEKFYKNYTSFLNKSLYENDFSAGVVLHMSSDNNGLGNRVPALITSFLLAMLNRKVFLTTYHDFDEYFDPVGIADVRWSTWNHNISHVEWHDLDCTSDPVKAHRELMTSSLSGNHSIRFTSWDWNAPILFANENYRDTLRSIFPKYAAFHFLARKLIVPSYKYRLLIDKYVHVHFKNQPYTVGMHIRMHKEPPNRRPLDYRHFVSVALKLLMKSKRREKAVFVASDDKQAKSDTMKLIQRHVPVFSQEGSFFRNHTGGGNPGTEGSAILDFFVLAHADDLICTHGSSFGHIAAGLAGKNCYSIHYERNEGFLETDVTVTQTFTPEPCWYISKSLYKKDEELRLAIRNIPGWEQHLQCHYYVEV